MALSGHLRELRNRLLVCVICLTAVFTVSLYFAGDIVELLTEVLCTRRSFIRIRLQLCLYLPSGAAAGALFGGAGGLPLR